MELKIIPIGSVIVGDRFRQDLGDLDTLVESIKKEGIIQPLAVKADADGKYFLLAGGRRMAACEKAGKTEIPVRIYTEDLSPLEMRNIELMENIARKDLSWAEATRLKAEIHALQVQIHGAKVSTSPDAVGVSKRDTAALLGVSVGGLVEDINLAKALDAFPDLEKMKTKSDAVKSFKKIQESMLMAEVAKRLEAKQASTPIEVVRSNLTSCYILDDFFNSVKKIPDNSIDIVELDPPYGIDLLNTKKESDAGLVTQDYNEVPAEDYPTFLSNVFRECFRTMSENSWIICWFAVEPWGELVYRLLLDAGFKGTRLPALWVKTNITGQAMQPETYLASVYEPFYYMRKGNPIITRQGRPNVFSYKVVPSQRKIHPTERPIELIEDILQTFGWTGCRLLVPFLGSGNSLLAASNLGITALGFDNVEAYRNAYILRVNEGVPMKYKSFKEEKE